MSPLKKKRERERWRKKLPKENDPDLSECSRVGESVFLSGSHDCLENNGLGAMPSEAFLTPDLEGGRLSVVVDVGALASGAQVLTGLFRLLAGRLCPQ